MKSIPYLLSLLLSLLLFGTLEVSGQEKSKAILIYDASGSMWGQIDGKPKIEIAREVASDLIKERPETLELGFMAYGHRRKGDCSDIELLIAPGSESTESLLSVVGSIVPRGKTPIFDSVLQAAEALRFTEQAASVILVTDGLETCGGDLDALGKLLKEQGIDFKTHIVGFAMTDAETAPLRNLSATTGGLYADAGNAEQLRAALQKALVAVTKPVSTLTLVPVGEDGSSLLKNGVQFEIYSEKASETTLANGKGGQITFELDPGSYHATASFAGRTLEAEVDVAEARDTTHTFTFSAPSLKLDARLNEGGETLTQGIGWKVLGEPNAEGTRAQVAFSYDAAPTFRLAPGNYLVVATRGNAKVEKEI
ncbi:MAG: VWA domain-containing protein, partial [Verrucomicrobiota bacterium]